MKKILFIFFLLPIWSKAQNTIGLPDITNYKKQVYKAGLQNWDFVQDKTGVIYVANNEGLLTYDGRSFKLFPLPNKTIVRSLAIARNKIFVGAQDEIGYFEPNQQGKLIYTSLVGLLPENERSFGDIWDIVSYNNDIYFRGALKIFRLKQKEIISYPAPKEWSYMGVSNGKLYAHDYTKGLLVFEKNSWQPYLRTDFNLAINNPVTAILPLDNKKNIIATLKNGLFVQYSDKIEPFNSPNNAKFIQDRIYGACAISKDRLALATNNNGVYIVNNNGDIIQKFSKAEGLQNKNVLSVFTDAQSNLWLGLDNGIDMIRYNSPIKQIIPLQQDGSGYTALLYNNMLYAGTSGGLFSIPLTTSKDISFTLGNFSKVANIEGQIWRLEALNNHILLGSHEGAYTIQSNVATKISKQAGFWNFVDYNTITGKQAVVAGNYNGIQILDYANGKFIDKGSIPGFKESSRFVAVDKNNIIWVSHPYHGIYKIAQNLTGSFSNKLYNHKNGLPSALNNHIYKIKNEVVVATEKGIYTYNSAKDTFQPSDFYGKLLGNQSIRYIKEDRQGNIWFIHDNILGVAGIGNKIPKITFFPELTGKLLSGFEFIYPIDSNNVLVAAERGFFNINYEKYRNNVPTLQVQIRSVVINNKSDSVLFGGYFNGINKEQKQNNVLSIANDWKTWHFEFSTALFGYEENIEYSYRLKGYDNAWSEYNKNTVKEYTNLSAGTYTFEVKAKNNFGKESTSSIYAFKILPPWYLTIWAKIFYILVFIVGNYIFYKWLKRKFRNQQLKHEEEQKRLLYIHDLERTKTESEMIVLRNAKLEAEINLKNTELASSAMHLVKKGELLTKVKSDLSQVMKGSGNMEVAHELKKMIRSLSDDDKLEEEWKNFTMHFDQVHSNFFKSLKEKHPGITNSEVKLSAYLRMNLNTKEIAQLLNISVRGVEIGRYRLRKKLALPTETNLFDYLIKIDI